MALRRTQARVLVALLVPAFGTLPAACSSLAETTLAALGGDCLLDSDCEGDLACVFARCHERCATSADCSEGSRCVVGEPPVHVCLLPEETSCGLDSDCVSPLVCGPDGQCRDECQADPDCVSDAICTRAAVCALASEAHGGPWEKGPGNEGEGCVSNADCAPPMQCEAHRCRQACKQDGDCPSNVCDDGLCAPLGPVGPICVPGFQITCDCSTGGTGVAICQEDGATFGPCLGCGSSQTTDCINQGVMDPAILGVITLDDPGGAAGPREVAISPAGDVIVVAGLFTQMDFGDGLVTQTGSIPYGDGFVAAYPASGGAPLWVRTFPEAGAQNVVFSSDGFIWVVGPYWNGANLGGGAQSGTGHYALKLDSTGAFVAEAVFPNVNWNQSKIAADRSGGVVVFGHASGTFDLGGGTIGLPTASTTLVFKLDPSANHVFSHTFGDPTVPQEGYVLLAVDDDDDVLVTGRYSGQIDFGSGAASASNSDRLFVASFGPDGQHLWDDPFADVPSDYIGPTGIVAMPDGTVLVQGTYVVPPDFGDGVLPGTQSTFELTLDGADGSLVVSDSLSPIANGALLSIDGAGRVVMSGRSAGGSPTFGTCTLDPGFVMARRDSSGFFDWARSYASSPSLVPIHMRGNSQGTVAIFFQNGSATPIEFGGTQISGKFVIAIVDAG